MSNIAESKKAFIAFAALMLVSEAAFAGTGGTYLTPLLDFMITSLEGVVGKAIGVAGILYGLVSGIKNGNLVGFGTGIGLAVGAYYGPDIVTAMSTGVL